MKAEYTDFSKAFRNPQIAMSLRNGYFVRANGWFSSVTKRYNGDGTLDERFTPVVTPYRRRFAAEFLGNKTFKPKYGAKLPAPKRSAVK